VATQQKIYKSSTPPKYMELKSKHCIYKHLEAKTVEEIREALRGSDFSERVLKYLNDAKGYEKNGKIEQADYFLNLAQFYERLALKEKYLDELELGKLERGLGKKLEEISLRINNIDELLRYGP